MRSRAMIATIAALLVGLAGPPVLVLIGNRILGNLPSMTMQVLGELVMWAFLAFVLFVVVYVEKRPIISIGLRRPDWSTFVSGLLLGISVLFILPLITKLLVHVFGFSGPEKGLVPLRGLPIWFRVFLALTGGIIEETLYRGYAVERLATLTGRDWLGGLIAAVIFGLAHIPAWGVGFALSADLPFGIVMTIFYLWRRDLVANIIAHTTALIVGLLMLAPAP
jgi:membrane protease YdiL (CAAX protease family)